MTEPNLLNLKNFGKSSFSSVIGTIYYVWPVQTVGSQVNSGSTASSLNKEAKPDSYASLESESNLSGNTHSKTDVLQKTICFLSNSEKSFDYFINFLRNKFSQYCIIDTSSPEIEQEVSGYLNGKIREISLKPAYLCGTDFEKKIWETARKIPYGNVASYKELTEKAGYPNAFRAAGTALGNNPLMLVVPCHRVIRSNGEIGYFGGGEEIKLMLLDLEQPLRAE